MRKLLQLNCMFNIKISGLTWRKNTLVCIILNNLNPKIGQLELNLQLNYVGDAEWVISFIKI